MLGIDPKTARTAWGHAAIYASVLLLLFIVWVIRKTLLVFATALMIAYLLYPLVDEIDRRFSWKTRMPALLIPFVLIFTLLAVFGWFIRTPLRNEYTTLYNQISEKGFSKELTEWQPLGLPIGEQLVDALNKSEIVVIIPQLSKVMRTAVRYILNLFIIPLLSFFILKDGRAIRDSFVELFENKHQAEKILMDAHILLLEYMRSLLLLCLATLVSFVIVLNAIRVPYPTLLALIAFPLEFVPLVGPLVSAIVIVGVSKFNHYPHLLWVVAFLIAYRLFQDYVLSPHLMRKSVKLDPLLIIFGVFAGAEIGNVPGIFLSVPVLALLRLVFYEWHKRPAMSRGAVVSG